MSKPGRCVIVLGGSFDPVHAGHVALASYFVTLLAPDELRIIPTGNPWQRAPLQATAEQRVAMLQCAFDSLPVPVVIDLQEIERDTPTYTIETLRALRATLGPEDSLVFLLGADQLRQLDTWREWRALFSQAHLCAASRPGHPLEATDLPPDVAREFQRRAGTAEQIRHTPHGLCYIARNLAIDVSATAIRDALRTSVRTAEVAHEPADAGSATSPSLRSLLPGRVLDYINHHRLYQN